MRCLDCGGEMQLIDVPDEGMASTGYERHAFECPNCRKHPDRLLKPVTNERIRLPPTAPLIRPALTSGLSLRIVAELFRRHGRFRQFRRTMYFLVALIAIASATAMISPRHGPQGLKGLPGPPGPQGARGDRGPLGAASGLRFLRAKCDETSCSVKCSDDEMLLTAYCGAKRNAAIIPTERSATCRTPVPANSPILAACVKMPAE
jgi:hypothetical protein